jgi:hypothetical protein
LKRERINWLEKKLWKFAKKQFLHDFHQLFFVENNLFGFATFRIFLWLLYKLLKNTKLRKVNRKDFQEKVSDKNG